MRAHSYISLAVIFICFHINIMAQASDPISLGYEKLEARELDEAIKLFSQALNNQPSDTSALSGIIRAHLLAENHRDAQRAVDNALKLYPDNPEFHLRQGILNNLRGQPRRAIQDLNTALEHSRGRFDAQIYLNRGISYMQDERYDDAIADFTQVLENNPRHATALGQRAFSFYRLGNFAQSIDDYNKAIDLNPDNAMNYYNRGMAHLRSGNRVSACPDFHEACRRGNRNACRMIMTECTGGRN